MIKRRWECKTCQWEGFEDDVSKRLYFLATQYEPEEWLWYCPNCNGTHLERITDAYCARCDDEIVPDEDQLCHACIGEQIEILEDYLREGHEL